MLAIHRTFFVSAVALFFIASAMMSSCSSGDAPLELVDPDAVPHDPDFELVFNIIQNECAPCHDDNDDGEDEEETRGSRLGLLKGVEPSLQTCDEIFDQRDDIWDEIEKNTMPPGAWPRLSSAEKLIIQRWLENGAVVPCR